MSYAAAAGLVAWEAADPAARNSAAMIQFAVGLTPRRGALEYRGELGWLLGPSPRGPVSIAGNGLAPITFATLGRAVQLQSYLTAGVGVYGVGSVGPELGPNAGAGIRARGERGTLFMDLRRHWATDSYAGVFGVAIRP